MTDFTAAINDMIANDTTYTDGTLTMGWKELEITPEVKGETGNIIQPAVTAKCLCQLIDGTWIHVFQTGDNYRST